MFRVDGGRHGGPARDHRRSGVCHCTFGFTNGGKLSAIERVLRGAALGELRLVIATKLQPS
jgi:hypothetical protein